MKNEQLWNVWKWGASRKDEGNRLISSFLIKVLRLQWMMGLRYYVYVVTGSESFETLFRVRAGEWKRRKSDWAGTSAWLFIVTGGKGGGCGGKNPFVWRYAGMTRTSVCSIMDGQRECKDLNMGDVTVAWYPQGRCRWIIEATLQYVCRNEILKNSIKYFI
jgi:hypothetical protein